MGILIDSIFMNYDDCREKLKNIIFTNFFYYAIFCDDNVEIEFIKMRCRNLLQNELTMLFEDNVWENIWNQAYRQIQHDINDNMLFL